jgi:hypothetical protein
MLAAHAKHVLPARLVTAQVNLIYKIRVYPVHRCNKRVIEVIAWVASAHGLNPVTFMHISVIAILITLPMMITATISIVWSFLLIAIFAVGHAGIEPATYVL